MYKIYEVKVKDIREANIEALKIAKDVLTNKVEITPYIVARFSAVSGFNDVEVFIRTEEKLKDPFNNESVYEENIYYYLYETGDIIRVTFDEFERLLKIYVEIEIDRGVYIKGDEKQEYKELIKE